MRKKYLGRKLFSVLVVFAVYIVAAKIKYDTGGKVTEGKAKLKKKRTVTSSEYEERECV